MMTLKSEKVIYGWFGEEVEIYGSSQKVVKLRQMFVLHSGDTVQSSRNLFKTHPLAFPSTFFIFVSS